jgi:carbamoyl-phosphate synthase large subunit
LFVIEINPRASRTVPFVSKATGVPLAKIAARIAAGQSLAEIGFPHPQPMQWYAVKEAVFPFNRFSGVDPILGPEMKSTGEVMGMDTDFEAAYWKSQIAAGQTLPTDGGTVFLSAADVDKSWLIEIAKEVQALGYRIVTSHGTGLALAAAGVDATVLNKLAEKKSPNIMDLIRTGDVHLIINTTAGPRARADEVIIRSEAILRGIPLITTEPGARATLAAIRYIREHGWDVKALQDYFV